MEKRNAIRWAVAAALVAVVAPLVLASHFARQNALADEYGQLSGYARDVLARTEGTTDQASVAFDRLEASRAPPCSEADLAMMREIDLASSYIQAVGRSDGNRLVCSSMGLRGPGPLLGPVDVVSPRKVRIRVDVRFPFAPGVGFLVLERNGVAIIIHKSLPIDATTHEDGVTLATFLRPTQTRLTSRGTLDARWLQHPRTDGIAQFTDADHIVVIVDSKRYFSSALAAAPRANLDHRIQGFTLLLLPVGLLAAILLATAIVFLTRAQLALPAVLRSALRNDELSVVYQPIVELATGRWVGAEALVRWRRSNGEMVRPDLFIPIAEEVGLIHQVTARVLSLVAVDLGVLAVQAPDFHVSVNLAPADMHLADTSGLLAGVLKVSGAAPGQLHVEATERGFIRTDEARRMIEEIRATGIRVAIDDFGTGYSSLSMLESFPLDFLKIDKSFVESIGSEAATSLVIPHIIEMGRSLKLEMVAEGVETRTQADYLVARGVQFAQGWLFARPMAFDQLLAGLRSGEDAARPAV